MRKAQQKESNKPLAANAAASVAASVVASETTEVSEITSDFSWSGADSTEAVAVGIMPLFTSMLHTPNYKLVQ